MRTQREKWDARRLVGNIVLLGVLGSMASIGKVRAQTYPAPSPAGARVEIPFELYNGNLVVMKAAIGKLRDVKVILDTGTSPSAISKEVAKRLSLPGATESLQTLSGTIQTTTVVVPELEVGPLRVESLRATVQDLEAMQRTIGVVLGGIVGLDVLGAGPFAIDYERRRVVFGSIAPARNLVPLVSRAPFLTVKTEIDGQPVRLMLDSGTWEVLVFSERLRTQPRNLRLDRSAAVSSVGGRIHLNWIRAVVRLGAVSLGSHDIAVVDANPDPDFDGLLGFAQMGFRRVAFDFDNGVFSWD